MKKLILAGFAILFLNSCSNDDSNPTSDNSEVVISSYKITSITSYADPSASTFKSETTGNLQNGKLFSETFENFQNNVSIGAPITTQTHFYNGDLLVKQVDLSGIKTRFFYYDNQNRMIGAKMTLASDNGTAPGSNFYRFTHVSSSLVYFEKISSDYNDPAAQVFSRNILEFDSNNNIIKAGADLNLDGIAENQNLFTYVGENLVSITKYDGTVSTFNYSNVIDNFFMLREKSYGKKNYRIICSEEYLLSMTNITFPSKNILSDDFNSQTFEVLENSYYKKKTKNITISIPEGQNITTTEFFFN